MGLQQDPLAALAPSKAQHIQGRLFSIAALFLLLYSLALSMSPVVRSRGADLTWRWDHWIAVLVWLAVFRLAHVLSERWLPAHDPYLLPLAAMISGWGVLSIWRLLPSFGLRQSAWLAVAVILLAAGLRLESNLELLRRYKYLWLTGSLALTAATFLFGVNPLGYGPRMWLGCCGVYLQPSEPLKLLLIAYLAAYMADRKPFLALTNLPGNRRVFPMLPLLAPTLIMFALALILLVVQRDLGTATVFMFIYAVIVYVASGRQSVVVLAALATILAAGLGYGLFDVVRLRLDTWLNPWADPSGRSYQVVQSLMSLANGGLLGRGPGLGSPDVVPVAHSDLIYTVIVEEQGLVGAIGLLLLLSLLCWRGMRAALRAGDDYRRYLAAGLTAYLVGQGLFIVAGSVRLLPLTGITLPLLSYGGSSLVTCFLAILLLLHTSQPGTILPASPPLPRPYLQLSGVLFAGLVAAALATGWWITARAPQLLARTDNPRRIIYDRYVRRGALLDRNGAPMNSSTGTVGSYTRSYHYPDLSNVLGYNNPLYGQSGLEASLDGFLSGATGYPAVEVWWNRLVYGQPPPGLDVRLCLDLKLQQLADQKLGDHAGALVLLNSRSGEILAMASHPTFDANQLEEIWPALVSRRDAPLLNRATLGGYLAEDDQKRLLPLAISLDDLGAETQTGLPGGVPAISQASPLRLSPLQAALIAAAINNGGLQPVPSLVKAIKTPQEGWAPLPPNGSPRRLAGASLENGALPEIEVEAPGFWRIAMVVHSGAAPVTWLLGGYAPPSQSDAAPLALALVLEEQNLSLAQEIGANLLDQALVR